MHRRLLVKDYFEVAVVAPDVALNLTRDRDSFPEKLEEE
jgi:hypothetical protein